MIVGCFSLKELTDTITYSIEQIKLGKQGSKSADHNHLMSSHVPAQTFAPPSPTAQRHYSIGS